MRPTVEKCKKFVNRGDYRWPDCQPCGRNVVQDDKCKIHLRVDERRKARDLKRKTETLRGEELQKKAKELSRALGVRIQADYSIGLYLNSGGYTGRMVVPLEFLEVLIENGYKVSS